MNYNTCSSSNITEAFTHRNYLISSKSNKKKNVNSRLKNSLLNSTVEKFMVINMNKLKAENEELKFLLAEKDRVLKEKEIYILNLIDEFNKFKSKQQDIYDVAIRELKDKIDIQKCIIDKMQSYIPDSARSSVHQIDYEQYCKYKEKQESPEQKAEFDIAEDKLANISDIEPIEEDLLTDEILDQELFNDVFDEKYESQQKLHQITEQLKIKNDKAFRNQTQVINYSASKPPICKSPKASHKSAKKPSRSETEFNLDQFSSFVEKKTRQKKLIRCVFNKSASEL